MKIKSAVHIHS